MVPSETLSLTIDQAQQIADKHFPSDNGTVVALTQLPNHGFSHTRDTTTYVVDIDVIHRSSTHESQTRSCSFFLTISIPPPANPAPYPYQPNSLSLARTLLTLIRSHTDIPILESIVDTSTSLIPYHYLLSPLSPFISPHIISVAQARRAGLIDAQTGMMLDLMLGKFLGQLHSGVQNDWYGVPESAPQDPSYSWQDTFVGLLEGLLTQLEESGYKGVEFGEVRSYLSRAIASFLFEDVEVPSLVWFTGSEEDIYLGVPAQDAPADGAAAVGEIAAILPNVAHALWGDPLLECLMLGQKEEGPSEAFMEGYLGGGGAPLIVFKRQGTKRIWYTVFLALLVLGKYGVESEDGEETFVTEKRLWARGALSRSIEGLKIAPCY